MTVRVERPCANEPSTAATDELGAYIVYMRGSLTSAQSTVTVSDPVSRPRYEPSSQTVTVRLPAPGSASSSSSASSSASSEVIGVEVIGGDFSLLHVITPSVTPAAVRPGAPLTLSAATTAPSSAKVVAELPDGTTVDLQQGFGPDANGWTDWSGTTTVAANSADGSYEIQFCAIADSFTGNCSAAAAAESSGGSRVLSTLTKAKSYIVDSRPPEIDPTSFTPADFGNTVFAVGTTLAVQLRDAGPAGIDIASATVVLHDVTAGSSQTISGAGVSYDPSTQWLRAPLSTLSEGHVYRAALHVRDHAGNSLDVSHAPGNQGGGFLVTTAAPAATTAEIPATPCRLESGTTLATKTAICENVPLAFGSAAVSVGATRRPGAGYARHSVPLDGAIISTGGLPGLPAHNRNDPGWAPRAADLLFEVPSSAAPQTVMASARTIDLPELRVEVPATWTSADLSMPSTTTTPSLDVCADPTTRLDVAYCSPDPLASQYLVKLDAGTDVAAKAAAHATASGGRLERVYGLGYRVTAPYGGLARIAADLSVEYVERFILRTGPVDAATARAAVAVTLSADGLPEGLSDLQGATVGAARFAPGVPGGLAGYEVPLYRDGVMVGYGITSASFEAASVLRIAHGDLDARVAERRTELEELAGATVVATELRHGSPFTEVAHFTLNDGRVFDVYVNRQEPLSLATLGEVRGSAFRPAIPADLELDHQRMWNASTTESSMRSCLPGEITVTASSSSDMRSICGGGGGGGGGGSPPPVETVYVPGGNAFPNYQWHRGCVPTAAAMVEAYWSEHGRRSIMSQTAYAAAFADPDGDSSESRALINEIRSHLQTDSENNTSTGNIEPGIEAFERSKGVDRPAHKRDPVHASQLKDQINNKKEPAVFSITDWNFECSTCPPNGYNSHDTKIDHAVALIGYHSRDGKCYMIVHTDAKVDGDAMVLMDSSTWDHAQFDYPTDR